MKKLILSAVLLPLLMLSVAAAELYSYLPEKPVAIFEFINHGVMDSPMVSSIRKAFPEFDAAMKQFPEESKNYVQKCCGAVYANGAYVMILAGDQLTEENTAKQYEEFLAELRKANNKADTILTRETKDGRTIYKYSDKGNDVIFVHLEPGVAMLTAGEHFAALEQTAKCNEADFANFRTGIEPATIFAFKTTDLLQTMIPAATGPEKGPEADLRSIAVFCDLHPASIDLRGDIGFAAAESVQQAQLQANQMMMVLIGIGLGQDPDLSGDVMKAIRILAKDKTLQVRAKFSDALLIRLGKYCQKSIENEKAKKAAKAAAAGDPAAPKSAPAVQK